MSMTGRVIPIVAVASVDATRDFYVDTLGFSHQMGVVGKDGQLDFCSVLLGEAQVMFSRDPAPVPATDSAKRPVDIYMEVDDVDAYHGRLTKKQVAMADPLTTQWWGARTFKLKDPNGYLLWFFTNVAEPRPPQGMKVI
jgi:PhnB protein